MLFVFNSRVFILNYGTLLFFNNYKSKTMNITLSLLGILIGILLLGILCTSIYIIGSQSVRIETNKKIKEHYNKTLEFLWYIKRNTPLEERSSQTYKRVLNLIVSVSKEKLNIK